MFPGKGIGYPVWYSWASLVAQRVKNPPEMQETWVRSLGWEDHLEEGMATNSRIFDWRSPTERWPWRAIVHGVVKCLTWGVTKHSTVCLCVSLPAHLSMDTEFLLYQLRSVAQSCLTFCNPMDCSTPGFTNSWSLLKLRSIKSVMPSNHLILCDPLLLPPSIFPSIRVFSNRSVLHIKWPKDWSFSFSISPSNE